MNRKSATLSSLFTTVIIPLFVTTFLGSTFAAGQELNLQPGDHICFVGNALGERMQHHNHFEQLLHERFADHQLVVRNLCFPGDEPFQRLRSFNFGSPDDHLTHSKASVILYFFGYNESFAGDDGLAAFEQDLDKLVRDTKAKDYSGNGPPEIALISPIAFENTGDPNLPDGVEHNERLEKYAAAIRRVATENSVAFADLFTESKRAFLTSDEQLTLNGFHLNDKGYRWLAPVLMNQLFGAGDGPARGDRLKRAIDDKNFHWWHRYRAVNGYSIYGKRNQAGFDGTYRNVDVMERERAILDQMCANRDQRIWKLAEGLPVDAEIDDSNTLPFFDPKSNVTGPDNGKPAYLSAEEQQNQFKLAPGYAVDLIATAEDIPDLANPVALNFDSDGRLWVAVMHSYPQWKPKSKLNDKILILTDQDESGRYHGSKTFAEGLHQPTGFELGHGGVFVAQQPDVLFLRDKDGDDRADERIRRLIGFDTADSHHGLAAFEWGPGGGLYFQEGTFKQSQVETLHGVERLSDAGVWRYDPRTEDMRVFVSVPFANPWGHVFNQWGQDFIADASDGLNYWAAPMSGRIPYPQKHPGGWIANKGWDKLPLVIPRRIRPTSGCELVSTRQFPTAAQGNYLLNNVIGFQGVLQHTLADDGAGYQGTEIEPLIFCEDENFRPVDLQFGPDGCLYIVDWHNALIGHLQHNLRDPHRDRSHGRIWRVRYAANPTLNVQKLSKLSVSELFGQLPAFEDRTRYRVRRELAARNSDETIEAASDWLRQQRAANSADLERNLLEVLWVHQTHNRVNSELLREALNADRHEVRAAAVRVLSFWIPQLDNPLALLSPRISDPHPRVRLEAVRACSFLDDSDAVAELALEVVNMETDPWIDYTLEETLRALGR